MNKIVTHPLKAFLCHASGDKPPVRELYKRLVFEGVDAWLDKEKLLPGQDWRVEIPRAVKEADVVIVFLSKKSISKEGYVQKEIKFALDIAEEKPEGTIFLIPARLEECVVPDGLSRWHWVDLYEENGFIQLLRSLKLRADVVGATVEPASYEESDKEIEHRVEQLYTEGLAAFYTEEWDKACQRFQTILSEYPNHKHAAEKIAEAEKQRSLAKYYAQAMQGYKAENWQAAIRSLEELLQKSAEYKDAGQLLRNARKQKQLKELYAEAKTLHAAQKWQAVLKVFEQISAVEPAFPDADGLLSSAQKEVAELKRLADLNDLYSHAVREMDAGQWLEARRLLEQVHKAQTGFLETERLLRKVEDEITKVEEHNKRNNQVNTLYEQAHGLIRSKNWRKALDKMEEIQKLEDQFLDKDGISEKAKNELAREEREAQRQNELATMYVEAVRLLKEEKYQEALDKWQEVKAVDPKYPDRQWVQRTARKKLAAKPVQIKPRFVITKSLWMGIVGVVILATVIIVVIFSGKGKQEVTPIPTSAPTRSAVVNPTVTKIADKTSTPRPATSVPATSGYSDPTMYDDFDTSGTTIDTNRWGPGGNDPGVLITRGSGILAVKSNGYQLGTGVFATRFQDQLIRMPFFIEGWFKLEPNQNGGAGIHLSASDNKGDTLCQIWGMNGSQAVHCQSFFFDEWKEISVKDITPGTWHSARIEVDPSTMIFTYSIDGINVGKYTPDRADELKNAKFSPFIWSGCAGDGCTDKSARTVTGYFDNVRMGAIADDPKILVYDSFNDSKFDDGYDQSKWIPMNVNSQGKIFQQDGQLVLTQSGKEKGQGLTAKKSYFSSSKTIIIQANLMVDKIDNHAENSIQIVTTKRLILCGLKGWYKFCWYELYSQPNKAIGIMNDSPAQIGVWYFFVIEVDPLSHVASFYINGKYAGSLNLDAGEILSGVNLAIYNMSPTGELSKGYVDNLRIITIDQP